MNDFRLTNLLLLVAVVSFNVAGTITTTGTGCNGRAHSDGRIGVHNHARIGRYVNKTGSKSRNSSNSCCDDNWNCNPVIIHAHRGQRGRSGR